MASQEQIAANRRNAQKSTGPRTPEGKARTAQNARTHGLISKDLLSPFEEEPELHSLANSLRDQYDPQSEMESALVEQILSALWRLRRIGRIETRHYWHRFEDLKVNRERSGDQRDDETQVYRDDWNGPKFLDALGRHQSRLERAFYRALHELEHIQSHRPDPPEQEELALNCKIPQPLDPPSDVGRAHSLPQVSNPPSNPEPTPDVGQVSNPPSNQEPTSDVGQVSNLPQVSNPPSNPEPTSDVGQVSNLPQVSNPPSNPDPTLDPNENMRA